jgi:hypothetical protein
LAVAERRRGDGQGPLRGGKRWARTPPTAASPAPRRACWSRPTAAQTYTVAGGFSTTGTNVTYLGTLLPSLSLFGGSGGNAINVPATRAETQVYLYPGSGANTVAIGSVANTLDTIRGPV